MKSKSGGSKAEISPRGGLESDAGIVIVIPMHEINQHGLLD